MRNQPADGKSQDHPADENGLEDSRKKQPRNTNDQRECSDDDGHGRIVALKMLRQCDGTKEQYPQPRKLAEHAVIRISWDVGEFHFSSFQLGVGSWQLAVGSWERLRMERIRPLIMAASSLVSSHQLRAACTEMNPTLDPTMVWVRTSPQEALA